MSSISLLRGADAVILGPLCFGGAVVITLKDPRNLPARPAQGIITYTPLGYSESVEFYHPTYDTPEKKERSAFGLPEYRLLESGITVRRRRQSDHRILYTGQHSSRRYLIEGRGQEWKGMSYPTDH